MVESVYVQKKIDELKVGIEKSIKHQKYEQSLELIYNCANLIYQTNLYYVDEYLEDKLSFIANKLNAFILENNQKDVIVFYDGFGFNNRGLARIYLNALCQLKKVIYVTYEDRKKEIPDILKILEKYKGVTEYIDRYHSTFVQQIYRLTKIISDKKPEDFFFYSFPNDVVGTIALNVMNKKVRRYQINLTDHAFWLGARCIDWCIEFRDYGASVSMKYRKLDNNCLIKIPFYPIIDREQQFLGFPFDLKPEQKIMFSGGALYKTFGANNKFYEIIDNILRKYKDVVFWYAGSGDVSELKILKRKYPNRVYHTLERRDLFQILEHCRLYISTYPICGGLMFQYAALAGVVPVTLKYDDDADGYLINQEELNVVFKVEDDLYREIDSLLMDDYYFKKRKSQLQNSVITDELFLESIRALLTENRTFKINFEDIDTDAFKGEYLKRLNYMDIDCILVDKNTIKTSIRYIPFCIIRGLIRKIIFKIFK